MATLEIKKAKTTTKDGKWFTFEVQDIVIVHGKVLLVPKNSKYQYMKLNIENCIIIK